MVPKVGFLGCRAACIPWRIWLQLKIGTPLRGFAPKGQAVRKKVKTCRAENLSMLPAFTIAGYIACNVYRGAVTKEDYIAFLEEDLLPLCGQYPNPRSIIIMDNCSIHHGPISS